MDYEKEARRVGSLLEWIKKRKLGGVEVCLNGLRKGSLEGWKFA